MRTPGPRWESRHVPLWVGSEGQSCLSMKPRRHKGSVLPGPTRVALGYVFKLKAICTQ